MKKSCLGFLLGIFLLMSLTPGWAGTPGTQKWRTFTDNWTTGAAALGPDGAIYFGVSDGFFALYPDGNQKFFYNIHKWMGTPAIAADGTIYAGSDDNNLHAIDPQGQKKWTFTVGCNCNDPTIGPDGTIYEVGAASYTSGTETLYALRPDGSLKWSYAGIFDVCAVGRDGTLYTRGNGFTPALTGICALTPAGHLKWNRDACSVALGNDGTIYATAYTAFRALRPDGSTKWETHPFPTGPGADSPTGWGGLVIGPDGSFYFTTVNNAQQTKVYALDATGQKKWEFALGTGYPPPLAVGADGTIYAVNGTDAKLYAIRPDGTSAWPAPFQGGTGMWGSTAPLIGPDGTIYVGLNDLYFYAVYSSSPGLAKSPWPMYHRDVRHTACALLAGLSGLIALLLGE